MKFNVSTMLKGSAIGIADVIPGVSGGTTVLLPEYMKIFKFDQSI